MTPTHETGDTHQAALRTSVDLILEIAAADYPAALPLLRKLFTDLFALYDGNWPGYQACQVGYHTLGHALDVALATARMVAGWNKAGYAEQAMPEHLFLCGVAAASFHDSGFIKEEGDNHGSGGKYTHTHVPRSMALAARYLAAPPWPEEMARLVPVMISLTEFHRRPDLTGLFATHQEEATCCMVATADLIAQMADVDYMERISNLFEEFHEAYEFEGREELSKRGVHVFNSAREMIDATISFYECFVLPRLKDLGRMDQYLITFFGEGRNPYFENITANLTGHLMGKSAQRRRLGEILQNLGVVTAEQVEQALGQQLANGSTQRLIPPENLKRSLLRWMDQQLANRELGDILIDMEAITPSDLRKGLLSQILPASLPAGSNGGGQWQRLLEIALLLQHIHKNPWLLGQIMEMITELLGCEVGTILLATPDQQRLMVMVPSGLNKDLQPGATIPSDKGLEGWVFRHGLPVMIADNQLDYRFSNGSDSRLGFETTATLAVPFYISGQCLGVMELFNKRTGQFTEQDMDLLALLASMIGNTLEVVITLQNDTPTP
ncbi:MAG: GAF domain-containing protein [Desulfobulbaceae bacterium]|nr:GAF domain-containing protein [Desulfobulbaceae bacterium]